MITISLVSAVVTLSHSRAGAHGPGAPAPVAAHIALGVHTTRVGGAEGAGAGAGAASDHTSSSLASSWSTLPSGPGLTHGACIDHMIH